MLTKVSSKRQATDNIAEVSIKKGQHKLQQVDPNLQVTVPNNNNTSTTVAESVQAQSQPASTVQHASGQQALFLGHPVPGSQQTNLQQSSVPTMWLTMWNPMQGQYMLSPTPPPPQVPWMSVGPSPTWTPAQYRWAIPQVSPPPQASSPPLNSGQANQGMQTQSQAVAHQPVPVTTARVATTMPAGAQPPTLVPAPMMIALSVWDAAGNLQLKKANHVPVATRNKIWQYQYSVPDEVTYDFYPDHVENKISFKAAKLHGKIANYTTWNKTFHILTELISVKWPKKCLDMVRYAAIISDLPGKFPSSKPMCMTKSFDRTYNII